MPNPDATNPHIDLDDRGYLVDFDAWTETIAHTLASADDIPALTSDHWRVIHVLRRHQANHGAAPMVRVLVRETGFTLGKIYDLFPGGPAKSACRIAGLPRPDSCV